MNATQLEYTQWAEQEVYLTGAVWPLLYAQGKASSMAEEDGDLESESFKKQLGSLLNCRSSDECGTQSKDYCARFCEVRKIIKTRP